MGLAIPLLPNAIRCRLLSGGPEHLTLVRLPEPFDVYRINLVDCQGVEPRIFLRRPDLQSGAVTNAARNPNDYLCSSGSHKAAFTFETLMDLSQLRR